ARWFEEKSKRGRFKKFFGEASFKEPVRLVFAHRRLSPHVAQDAPWVTHHKTPPGVSAEGVDTWLAFQDIRAATYLANSFYAMTGEEVELMHDKEIKDHFNHCAISIGLGFNSFTHWLAGRCKNKLYKITFDSSPRDPTFKTDFFEIPGKHIDCPEDEDYCIV